jgi:hypothetical protein
MFIMRLLSFILLSFLSLHAFSQEKKSIVFGVKAGAVSANAGPDYTDDQGVSIDYQSRFGIAVGGRLQVNAGKNFCLMPELTIVGKGANLYRDFNNGNRYKESPSLSSFLELTANLLLKSSSKSGSFFIGGGPSVAVNLDEYSTLVGKSDIGINALAGYQLPIGFSFELNFNKGLKKQIPPYAYNPALPDLKIISFGFSFGYFF